MTNIKLHPHQEEMINRLREALGETDGPRLVLDSLGLSADQVQVGGTRERSIALDFYQSDMLHHLVTARPGQTKVGLTGREPHGRLHFLAPKPAYDFVDCEGSSSYINRTKSANCRPQNTPPTRDQKMAFQVAKPKGPQLVFKAAPPVTGLPIQGLPAALRAAK